MVYWGDSAAIDKVIAQVMLFDSIFIVMVSFLQATMTLVSIHTFRLTDIIPGIKGKIGG